MNIYRGQISQWVLAAIFAMAILLPSAIQFTHSVFENHEHIACTDFSTHIHSKQLDCSICDFHFSSFDFKTALLPEFIVIPGFQKIETAYLLPKLAQKQYNQYLRGPPLHI